MIILPDKNIPRSKFLMPVQKKEWVSPSLAQPKDSFGKENRIVFQIKAHTNDGVIVWCGNYHDREDFDAVLFAIAEGTLKYQKQLWTLSTPSWDSWLGEIITYKFETLTILSTIGNVKYTRPSDWYDLNNRVECMGGGGSGGAQLRVNTGGATGGGGGSYSIIRNFSFGQVYTANCYIGGNRIGGQRATGDVGVANGFVGWATWFNSDTDPGFGSDNTKCSANGGGFGVSSASASVLGGEGGNTSLSWGETKYAGGRGGNTSATDNQATGGGGAAGSTGVGNNGVDATVAGAGTDGGVGGAGDAGLGAAGTAGDGTQGAVPSTAGGNGTNIGDGTVGTGGGGGSRWALENSAVNSSDGGLYGGGGSASINGGSGSNSSSSANAGNGKQGFILIRYEPRRRIYNST